MTRRQLAELLLTAHRNAERSGFAFDLSREKLIMMDLSHEDIDRVEWAVKEIQRTTETQLAALQ